MKRLTLCAGFVAAAVVSGVAMFAPVDIDNVPVARLVTNLERDLSEKGRTVELLLNLARIHSMAAAMKATSVPTVRGQVYDGNGVPDYKQFEVRSTNDPARTAAAREHFSRAQELYREVLAADPANEVAALGLGWTQIQLGDREAAVTTLRAVIARAWPQDAAAAQGKPTARTGSPAGPMHGMPFLTEEAARYLIPLLDPSRDAGEIAVLKRRSAELAKAPRWITPIAVPLAGGLSALDIVDDGARVRFDLDGVGARKWNWITADAAWLVFDRHDRRRVDSGLQLFGSVTFWLFWQNGYHALAALDDDADGEIRGRELTGLALWHDRNRNGISDKREVRPVGEWGIVALSTQHEYDALHPDEIAWSPRGVRFTDGSTRATYDVVLRAR